MPVEQALSVFDATQMPQHTFGEHLSAVLTAPSTIDKPEVTMLDYPAFGNTGDCLKVLVKEESIA